MEKVKKIELSATTKDRYGVWTYTLEYNDEWFLVGDCGSITNELPIIDIIPDFDSFHDGIIDDDVIEKIEEWLESR